MGERNALRRLVAAAFALGAGLALAAGARVAAATTGGPELSEPLGYEPRTGDVYFRQLHWNESGVRPTLYRLRPGRGGRLFEPVAWSIGEEEDSTYRARVAALKHRLRRLEERWLETIPDRIAVETVDTLRGSAGERLVRFRVRVEGPAGSGAGTLNVTTYRDPGVRVVRWYDIPGHAESIGIVAFRGIPFEDDYEVQVPVAMPGSGEVLNIPQDWWRGGYPTNGP